MLDNTLFDPEKLSIAAFEMSGAKIYVLEGFENNQIENFIVENNLQMASDINEKLIKADFSVKISTKSKINNENEATVNFQFVVIFKIENLENLSYADNGKTIIHHELASAIASTTYATARGILITKLENTIFQNFILPIINPNKLLENLN